MEVWRREFIEVSVVTSVLTAEFGEFYFDLNCVLRQYANRSEHAVANSKYTGLLGPLRSSLSNVRSTLRIEYIGTSGEGDLKVKGECCFRWDLQGLQRDRILRLRRFLQIRT